MLELKKKSVATGKFVDTAHVDTIIRNYKKERWVHNSQRLGKDDSLSVWYSVEELETFLKKRKSTVRMVCVCILARMVRNSKHIQSTQEDKQWC